MTLGSELWNVNETEPKDNRPKILCDRCGREMIESEAISIFDGIYGFNFLCEDCLADYAREISSDYIDEYIEDCCNERFYELWFKYLDDVMKMEIIKEAFNKPKYWGTISQESMGQSQEFYKKDFCAEQNGFLSYVIERIKG